MKATEKSHLLPLTGLRFLAALVVVAYHFATPEAGLLGNFVHHGSIGVTLFFVLSGFILSYSYVERPGRMRGSNQSFWAARFARIYPVYLVGLVMIAPFVLLWGKAAVSLKAGTAVSSVFLVQAWFHLVAPWNIAGMWNPPGWSLSAEAFFYLVFPFTCRPLSKLRTPHLLGLMAACWVASSAATLAYLNNGELDGAWWGYNPLLRLPEFVLGVAAGIAWKNRSSSAFDRASPYVAPLSLLAVIVIMCNSIRAEFLANGAIAPLFVLLICSLASNRGTLAAFLSLRPMVVLGGASYSLYILHWPLRQIFEYAIQKFEWQSLTPAVSFGVYLGFAILVSYVCFIHIEEPINRILRNLLIRQPATIEPKKLPSREIKEAELLH